MRVILTLLTLIQLTAAQAQNEPEVLGHGVGLFKVGKLIEQDHFENLDNWVVQIQEKSGSPEGRVEPKDGSLECWLPGRGGTIWFKKKLSTRVTITYDVLCPTPPPNAEGLQPRDINNFWMATDPLDPEQGLFDPERYTGAFGSYDKMHGYYASTGGGSARQANRTTRMRRYPREIQGNPAAHVALNHRDEQPGYLITPDKWMRIQLVAYDDVVQYIVDGKLNYQMRQGDRIAVESRDENGEPITEEATYDLERFPTYEEGYFGFRMVGTHHLYRNFKVHALVPDEAGEPRPTVRVSSLEGLREAVAKSHQQIILEPGHYQVADAEGFQFSGSNNDVDLTGVFIEVPLAVASGNTVFRLTGDHITVRGGTVEDTYPDGKSEVTDFGAYNHNNTFGRMNEMSIRGDDNRIIGMHLTVRGSFPYGYGNMYGIGRGSAVRLRKHCGIQITGNHAVIDGCYLKMEAFGHAIYVQGGDRTTVRNTMVEGTLRPSNDCYLETHEEDLAKRFNYQIQWPENVKGLPIPRDHMLNCIEDGIRAYKGAGDMIVDRCVVKKARGGIKLYMAKSATVSNCQVLDCVVQGYSLPRRGTITRSSGNAAYGPLLYVHFDGHSDQQIDLEVIPAPHEIGDHPLAAIKGTGHSITLRSRDTATSETLRPIIVGYPMRFDFLSVDFPKVPAGYEAHFERHAPDTYTASGIELTNETPHPVVLGKHAQGNHITSVGTIRDLGTDNTTTSTAR